MRILFFLIIAIILTSCGAVSPMASDVKLDLSRKGLTQIPAEVFENKELKVLKLFGNQLDSVSNRIGELVNLEELYIGKNNLSTLPKEIGQ
jgi:Leucine-rich repeat (LRR) protein